MENGNGKLPKGGLIGWSSSPKTAEFMENVHLDSLFFPLFDSLHDVCFFVKNAAGEMVLCNRNLLGRFGFKSEKSIVGKTDFDLHPHQLARKYLRDDHYVMNLGKPLLKIVEVFPGETGIPGWYMTDKYPVRAKNGAVIGVMGVIQKYAHHGAARTAGGKMGAILTWIDEHVETGFDVSRLAAAHNMSVRALERLFKEQIGLSPKQYAIRRRIFQACDELQRGDKPLGDIAVACGFYDQSAFSRAFKLVMGLTPQTYRNLYR